jgi:dihydrofolate reductase
MGVVYYCAASLDGYIAESDDTLDWLLGYQGSYEDEDAAPARGYDEFYERVGALVSGSVTYEFILDHMEGDGEWPYSGKPCWILSSRDLPLPGGDRVDVRVVEGSVSELFDEMVASAGGRDLWVVGGGNVASQFADAGLLDELRITVVPVVLGAGKPLFDRRLEGPPLQLEQVIPRRSGMVELGYRVDY